MAAILKVLADSNKKMSQETSPEPPKGIGLFPDSLIFSLPGDREAGLSGLQFPCNNKCQSAILGLMLNVKS